MAEEKIVNSLSGSAKKNPYVDEDGEISAVSFSGFNNASAQLLGAQGDVTNGIGAVIGSKDALTAAGSRIASFQHGGTEKAAIDKNGVFTGSQVYGGCYEFNESGSTITLTSNASTYQWITGQAGTLKGTGYMTYDAANYGLLVGAYGAGVYLCNVAFAGTLNLTADLDAMVKVGANVQNNIRCDQAISTQANYQAGSMMGLLTLAAGDLVTLWFGSDTNTRTLTVKHVNMTLVRVG